MENQIGFAQKTAASLLERDMLPPKFQNIKQRSEGQRDSQEASLKAAISSTRLLRYI
jgi:hypothetical protein